MIIYALANESYIFISIECTVVFKFNFKIFHHIRNTIAYMYVLNYKYVHKLLLLHESVAYLSK